MPREVALYTLADRRRLDTTPGLTCIWQVTGRSAVSFAEWVDGLADGLLVGEDEVDLSILKE